MATESWQGRFEDEFPAMGRAGDPKDDCIYRFDQYENDKSKLITFIEELLATERAALAKEVAGMKKMVGEVSGTFTKEIKFEETKYNQALDDILKLLTSPENN